MKNIVILLLIIIFIPSLRSNTLSIERCIMCGMDSNKSETKFEVHVSKGTKEIASGCYSFCCLHCVVLFKYRLSGGEIGSILVRDYNTVTSKYDSGEMIEAKKGFYLVESELLPKGSMVPFMLVFSTYETANKFRKVYGGRIFNWKEVWGYTESYDRIRKSKK
ncbi:MAG: nitrous oxide reductase accessory protein NosL [Spirochaetota bacterium]|nr:nitrous oxide reductase accessory protein NosL [Spirochaetota bacterium]